MCSRLSPRVGLPNDQRPLPGIPFDRLRPEDVNTRSELSLQ